MPDTAEPLDRAKAAKPVPKPGIMDIHAYVTGKASADGVAVRIAQRAARSWQA